jgi:hypothetical protein
MDGLATVEEVPVQRAVNDMPRPIDRDVSARMNERLNALCQQGRSLTPAAVRSEGESILADAAAAGLSPVAQRRLKHELARYYVLLSAPSGWNWPDEEVDRAFAEWSELVKGQSWQHSEFAVRLSYILALARSGRRAAALELLRELHERVLALPNSYRAASGMTRTSMLQTAKRCHEELAAGGDSTQ